MNKFWMVLVEGTASCKHRHYTVESAHKEAERLARQPENQGCRVYVLETTDYCQTFIQPVQWTRVWSGED